MSVWSQRFEGGAPAARHARHAARELLGGKLPERRLEDVELIVSELATNSIRHGGCGDGGQLEMEAVITDERVRLCVCDHGGGFDEDAPPAPHPDRAGGYGLVLLERLSDRWGTQRNGGFCVWFEVARQRGGGVAT
jgi:anti-sigma regulatory factor (Ser/Thr protein kinase)